MWMEAVFSREDLQSLVSDLVPFKIHLGSDADHHIQLSDAHDIALVEATGLRVTCRAALHWPVIGIDLPVNIESLTVLLKPAVVSTDAEGDTLAFTLEIESADFASMPALVDRGVTGLLNHELAERHVELSWNFASTLSHVFALPPSLDPLDGLDLRVLWGKVRITEEAMVMAVSFRPKVLRHDEHTLTAKRTGLVRTTNGAMTHAPHARLRKPVVVAAWMGLAAGVFFGARALKKAWS